MFTLRYYLSLECKSKTRLAAWAIEPAIRSSTCAPCSCGRTDQLATRTRVSASMMPLRTKKPYTAMRLQQGKMERAVSLGAGGLLRAPG